MSSADSGWDGWMVRTSTQLATVLLLAGCGAPADARAPDSETRASGDASAPDSQAMVSASVASAPESDVEIALRQYTPQTLSVDVSSLQPGDRAAIRMLIQGARQMDEVFWIQAFGDPEPLLSQLTGEERRLAELNYGPWDRLNASKAFLPGIAPKPAGANFYPNHTTRSDVESAARSRGAGLLSPFTMVHTSDRGGLRSVPYHVEFRGQHQMAADMLDEAAKLVTNPALRGFLELRGEALRRDAYHASDSVWAELGDNTLDIVIGPVASSEDQLLGVKAAHSGLVLLRDGDWRVRLVRIRNLLTDVLQGLPVSADHRLTTPDRVPALEVFDVLYAAGQANAGTKVMSLDLPLDSALRTDGRARNLQFRNVQQARFAARVRPMTTELLGPDQGELVTFHAFFTLHMFHQLAHDLRPREPTVGFDSIRPGLGPYRQAIEEAIAQVTGLLLARQLSELGELRELDATRESLYAAYVASLLHTVLAERGGPDARAAMVQFAYLTEQHALARDDSTGTYHIDFEQMEPASAGLANLLLALRVQGNSVGAGRILSQRGGVPATLEEDLARVLALGLPKSLAFTQGWDHLILR